MTKIPVGATIAHAYRFAFGHFLTLLGIVWMPWAIMAAVGLLLMHRVAALSPTVATQGTSQLGSVLSVLLPAYAFMFVLLCMQMVGVTQQALGLRRGSPYYYFSLGKPLWRLIGAFLLVFVILITAYVGAILLGLVLA